MLARRKSGRSKLQGQDGDLATDPTQSARRRTDKEHGATRTLGPEAGAVDAPGTIPRLAFQRASDSSSASSFAYSSTLFAALGL